MNCRKLQDWLEEYEDQTLSSRDRAVADQHFADCAVCRETLLRHRQIRAVLSEGFEKATQSLRLRPEVEERVLRDLRSRAAPASEELLRWWLARLAWPWAVAAGLLLTAGLLFWQFAKAPNFLLETNHSPKAAISASIRVSYEAPSCTFQKQGAFIKDRITYQTVMVNTSLWPGNNRNH